MLSHYWTLSDNTQLNTNVAYQFGKIGNSRLDFNGARNPDPTYYRNLPSYYTTMHNNSTGEYIGDTPANQALAELARVTFLNNNQINWDNIYRQNIENAALFGGESLTIL